VETLRRFVQWNDDFAEKRKEFLDALGALHEPGFPLICDLLSQKLRQINEQTYREIEKSEPLSDVLRSVAGELLSDLQTCGAVDKDFPYEHVIKSVYKAAQSLFGMEDVKAENDGPMDKRPYHVAIQIRYRQQIKNMTTGRLVAWGLIPAYQGLRDL
jgi:hypothetical protein